MTPVNEVLIRYIDRLEKDVQQLKGQLAQHKDAPCGADIKKALHDASNVLGLRKTYRITDPDAAAVEWIKEIVQLWWRGKDK